MEIEDTQTQIQNGLANGISNGAHKLTAAQKRRLKRKNKKGEQKQDVDIKEEKKEEVKEPKEDIQIEYVAAPLDFETFESSKQQDEEVIQDDEDDEDDYDRPMGLGGIGLGGGGLGNARDQINEKYKTKEAVEDLKRVFEKFYTPDQLLNKGEDSDDEEEDEKMDRAQAKKATKDRDDDDNEDEDFDDANQDGALKKKDQRMNMSIAELKSSCPRPEVVEVWDTTAEDPKLLTFLKAYRNTVPVPRHWSQKRKYLQGKRGIEKPAFALPDFIEATGISELRNVYSDKETDKNLKQKQREKMRPKMNTLDIAPEILIDAFFKHQTIPNLTNMGDLYYEGKEFEAKPKDLKPGNLSDGLKRALGMTENAPPPWLINMQRYGPPPSYPYLKIPGLNAPIPKGAQFGFQPGAWGKPPVNENGEPLYGDVFGEQTEDKEEEKGEELVKDEHWGEEMEAAEEEEEEESEEEESDEDDQALKTGLDSIAPGINSSIPTGLIMTEDFNLRKQMGAQSVDSSYPPPQYYQVLEQKQVSMDGKLMGGDHVYVMPEQNKKPATEKGAKVDKNAVQMAIDPEVLEDYQQDPKALQALYEQQLQNDQSGIQSREAFVEMVAQNNAAQKRRIQEAREKQQNKKQKQQQQQFKF